MTKTKSKIKVREAVEKAYRFAEPIIRILIPILILALGVGIVLYYILGPSKYYMTSDSTDSMRWAQASFESGKLISDNFAYAAILPFGGNLIFLPFIAIFGYSVKAQVLGLAFFAVLLALAMYYMGTGLRLGHIGSASLVSLFFIIMSSSAKLREIMWEHIFYYNLGILFFCLGVGMAARLTREDCDLFKSRTPVKTLAVWGLVISLSAGAMLAISENIATVKGLMITLAVILVITVGIFIAGICMHCRVSVMRDYIRLALLAVFSMLAATDGLQTLVCFALPVLAGVFCERLFDPSENVFSLKNLKACGVLAAIAAPTLIGYKLIEKASGGINAGYADAYSSYSAMSSWKDNFLGFFNNWFSLIGVSVANGDPLASKESIINMIGIFGGILLLIAPFILLFFWKKITSGGVKIALIGHFALSAFILFAVTFGKLGGANWRLTPMLGSSVLLTFITAIELIRQKKLALRVGTLIVAFMILIALPAVAEIREMDSDSGDNVAWHLAAERLEDEGLRYGYANFWFAESITLFSDGALEVANISENVPTPRKYVYQISRSAFDDREDDGAGYFLLLTEKENQTMSQYLSAQTAGGKIVRDFVITTPGYNLRGHSGTNFYVYVFAENIF